MLGLIPVSILLQSDGTLVFSNCYYARLARSYGPLREFVNPALPQQNKTVEQAIRTPK